MKIISYNVNGIRAAVSKGFLEWLDTEKPDVICLQEIKAQTDQIPALELSGLGYEVYAYPAQKKGYSGVAIFTRTKPDKVVYGMNNPLYDSEGRFIRVDYGDLSVVSVYHPSGSSGEERQDFKMQWLDFFQSYIDELKKERPNLILCGDYNICHESIDIHDPVRNATSSGFLPEERAWIDSFLKTGFTDTFRYFHKEEAHQYSWWSFRANARANNKGWRIDYILTSEKLNGQLQSAEILPNIYHSDHCPIVLNISN